MITKTLDTSALRKKATKLRSEFNKAIKAVEALGLGPSIPAILETEYEKALQATVKEHLTAPVLTEAESEIDF